MPRRRPRPSYLALLAFMRRDGSDTTELRAPAGREDAPAWQGYAGLVGRALKYAWTWRGNQRES